MKAVYLTGDLAKGLDSKVVDVTLIGVEIDNAYLARLIQEAERLIDRKIRILICQSIERAVLDEQNLLIYGDIEE